MKHFTEADRLAIRKRFLAVSAFPGFFLRLSIQSKLYFVIVSLGCPVFAFTSDQFPSMMVSAHGKGFTELGR